MTDHDQRRTRGPQRTYGSHAAPLTAVIIGGTVFLAVSAMTTVLVRDSGLRSLMFEDVGDFILANAFAAIIGFYVGAVAVLPCLVLLHRKPLRMSALFVFAPSFLAVELYVSLPRAFWNEFYPLASAAVALIVMLAMSVLAHFLLRNDPQLCRTDYCPQCAYDISGSASAGCPECGWGRARS